MSYSIEGLRSGGEHTIVNSGQQMTMDRKP
jgi:hypothetical protein